MLGAERRIALDVLASDVILMEVQMGDLVDSVGSVGSMLGGLLGGV